MSNIEVAEVVPNGHRMGKPINHHCPDQVYEVMCKCWQFEPNNRPTFDYFKTFFSDFEIATEAYYAELPRE